MKKTIALLVFTPQVLGTFVKVQNGCNLIDKLVLLLSEGCSSGAEKKILLSFLQTGYAAGVIKRLLH